MPVMVGVVALVNDGACRAVPCHGEVIEGGPCADAAHLKQFAQSVFNRELRDIP